MNNLPPDASAYVSRLLADAERDMLLDQAPVLFGEDDVFTALWNMNDALLDRVQTEEKRRRRAERNALRLWAALVVIGIAGIWGWWR